MRCSHMIVNVSLGLALGAGTVFGQPEGGAPRGAGPDLIVSDLFELLYWGASPNGTTRAYSVGVFACNIGDEPAVWYGGTDQHPVIGQNMFRLNAGRFEHIGQAWLKWAYVAENTNYCGACIDPGASGLLGVNCADPYEAVWNGFQPALGPKSQVNPFTGQFPAAHTTPPTTAIGGRLQVQTAEIPPSASTGPLYFLEGQLVSPDDAAADNDRNNTSYRQVWVLADRNLSFVSLQGAPSATVQKQPAIAAWKQTDPTVFLNHVDVPGDGRLYVARKAVNLGGGKWHYEIAIQNVNCDRGVGGLSVTLPEGAGASNLGFRAIAYHSGEPYDGTPWASSVTPAGVRWDTVDYAVNPNANVLRWGTLYNYWFDAFAPPESADTAEFRLFKPGDVTSIPARIGPLPVKRGDTNCDGAVTYADINPFVLALTSRTDYEAAIPGCNWSNADINGDGRVNGPDAGLFVRCLGRGGCP